MAAGVHYVPDPATRDTPIQLDEIQALRGAGGRAFRDPRSIEHLLERVEVTITLNRQEFNRLHRQVSQIAAERQHQGVPTSLDPASAARFLPPEEIDRMASEHLRARIEHAESVLAEVAEARRRVTGRVNAIKFAVATLLEDPELPPAARERFLNLVRSLPDPGHEPLPQIDPGILPQDEPPQPEEASGNNGDLDHLFD